MNQHTTCLELNDIGFAYPPVIEDDLVNVLVGIDLDVAERGLTILAGRSGSGKTTLLRIAIGLLAPTSGSIKWYGEPIHDLSDGKRTQWRRENVGVVLQGGGLIETLTAAENVALSEFGDRPAHDARQRTVGLLETTGVGHRATHLPTQLSTGEQQRVAVARALYADPPLVVADEPTANLDRNNADSIIALFKGLAVDRAVLVASHDPALIAEADTLLMLA